MTSLPRDADHLMAEAEPPHGGSAGHAASDHGPDHGVAAPLRRASITDRPPDERLVDLYHRYFMVLPADTPTLRRQAYALRFQVLSQENGYLDPADYPDGLEYDSFDAQSRHLLLLHRETGDLAGTARLVLPGDGPQPLPFAAHCADPEMALRLPLDRTGEVSRLSVSRRFRRRVSDLRTAEGGPATAASDTAMRRLAPHITLGLLQGLTRACVENRMTHVCGIMEPQLIRLLERFGIRFWRVGPLVPLFGWRQPCYRRIRDLFTDIRRSRPDVFDVMTDEGRLWDHLLAYDPLP